MMNLLFSPNGRINSSEFMRGAYVLIGIAFILALLPLVSYQLSMIGSIIGLVMLWCWIVLWIKRYHDSGKSGWMSLLPIIAFVILSMIVGMLVSTMGMSGMDPETAAAMNEAAEEAAASGDFGAMMSSMMGASEGLAKKLAIPNAISTAVLSLAIAFLFNSMIKQEPNDNQYGPVH